MVSVIPASGSVSVYSVTACGFEGLEFEEKISGTMVDYALRHVSLCLASWINAHNIAVIASTHLMRLVDQIGTRILASSQH